jgi:ribA/ribD-fused uncharacterized protein
MIDRFQGEYRWLSNFGEGGVWLDGIYYSYAEHAYQASKSVDPSVRVSVAALNSPGEAKRAGRQLEARPDWEAVKKRVMLLVVLAKFIQNPELQQKLIETGGHALVEGNTWHDNYWGNCVCDRCSEVPGANWLGRILEHVRDVVTPD